MSYPFTLFTRPHGRQAQHEMTHIREEDEQFLRDNNVRISMEDCGPFYTIWADDGTTNEDDEPDEITYIVPNGEMCEQSMANICDLVRKRQCSATEHE